MAEKEKGMTYSRAGVDIRGEGDVIRGLRSSLDFVRTGIGAPVELGGHFTGIVDIGDRYLSLCTDGVGSKIKIAEAMQKWDTIGIDCMAMNVNDMICIGAEPLAFVDYIAVEDPDPKILSEIGKGLNEGARQSNVSIIGGETATLPEIVQGLDLAGTCLGMVDKDKVITGSGIEPGDVILGLPSSGFHSNGFTLVRKVIEENEFDLTAWTARHNRWSTAEAKEAVYGDSSKEEDTVEEHLLGSPIERRRWLKNRLFYRAPLFVRPFLYFLYRYFAKSGYKDGVEGLIYHVLQAFWFRFLVDAKIYELRRKETN